jgi:hypothetical protein
MNIPSPTEGRASLSRNYRNLSERDIRAKLDAPLSDAERVTAKAELLRRNSGDNGPDTTLATGFAPTSARRRHVAGNDDGAIALDGRSAALQRSWVVWRPRPRVVLVAVGDATASCSTCVKRPRRNPARYMPLNRCV